MKITKKRKFIVAMSFAVLMAFGVVMVHGFNANTTTEVLAAETQERAVNFGDGDSDNRNWVNDFGIFNNERWHSASELQTRFSQSQSNFGGRFVTIGSWSMFNVNGFDNLEIHLVNSSIRFAINEDDMDDFFGSHIIHEESRAFLVTNHTTRVNAHGYIPSPNNSTVYIIDNPQGSNQNSMLTISVPRSDVWLFDSINITVENGSVEIADAIEEFLAENLTINGDVVRVSDDDIVRFAPNTRTNTQTNTQPNQGGQPAASNWEDAKEIATDYVTNSTNIQQPFTVHFNGLMAENSIVFFSVRVESDSGAYEIRIDVASGDIIQFAPITRTNVQPNTQTNTNTQQRPSESTTDFGELNRDSGIMLDSFPRRFPNADIPRNARIINFNGGWSNGISNLEVNLLNADLRIVPLEEGMVFWGFHRPNTPRSVVVEGNDRTTAHILHRGVAYIWDNEVAYDGLVTIHIPLNVGWIFDNANIHVEHGNIEIDSAVLDYFAENISVGGGRIDIIGGENVSDITANDTQAADLIGTWESITDSSVTMEFRQDGTVISRFGDGLSSLLGGIEGTWYVSGNLLTISKTVTVFGITSQGTGTGRFEITANNLRMYNQDGTYQDWIIPTVPLTPSIPIPDTPSAPSSTICLTEAIRIARNHIGLPLAGGASFSSSIVEMEGRRVFHFWINGAEPLTNLSVTAIRSFYEFRICTQTGEVLEFIEGTYPPNAR